MAEALTVHILEPLTFTHLTYVGVLLPNNRRGDGPSLK